jgi:hypothetical protein
MAVYQKTPLSLDFNARVSNTTRASNSKSKYNLRRRIHHEDTSSMEGRTSMQNVERIPPVRAKRHTGGMPPLTEWNAYPVRCLRFWWVH